MSETAQLNAALDREVRRGAGAEFSIASLTPFPWDTLYIFGPYTSTKQIAEALQLGAEEQVAKLARGIDGRDDVTLLVFFTPQQGWVSMAHPRSAGDFGPELLGHAYRPEDAQFQVRAPSARSWGNIGPLNP